MEFGEGKGSNKPGILTIEGVNHGLAADLFKSASEYFREFPWKKIFIHQVFVVSWANDIRFFLVSGNKLEPGIIYETNWDDTEALIRTGYHSNSSQAYCALLFVGEESMPFDDLDAMERFGWELASSTHKSDKKKKKLKDAAKKKQPTEEKDEAQDDEEEEEDEVDEWEHCYPLPVCFPTSPLKIEDMYRPARREILWFELASKIITRTSKKFTDGVPIASFREDNQSFFLNSGKATVNYSFWSSMEEYGELRRYIDTETARINAPKCKLCGKAEDPAHGIVLKNCANCKVKLYCSRDCQAKDWATHKLTCVKK
jgi:hypothetical protein